MGLSFLSPLFLIGLAGASIPIIIHLLNRERARRVLFSSLRFIKNAHQANVKRHKLKQLILLLMRTLMLAILALAFARPFFAQDPQIAEKGGRRNVVIILDNSYSMGYSDNFSRAKSEAMNVISDLNPQDTAALIFNSDTALVVKELSSEHDEIKMALNAHAKLTYNPTNYVNAIQAADEVLKFANIGEKVVYLISDLQKVGFQNFIETDRLSPGVDVNVSADLRVENPVNLAVTGISAPEIALNEKKPARIVARIANFSGKSLADVPVKLIIDGVQMGEQKVDILANDTADAIFDLNFTDEKTHTGYVELPGDKLPIDDKRYFTLQTLKSIKVFCLDGEPGRRSDEDETFFLTRALNPKNQVVSIQVSKSTRFPAGDEIKDYDVIILTNVSALGSDEVQRLRNFVKSGGGLIVALGDNVVPATYTKIFNSGAEALLPCNLVEAVGDESNHEQFNVIAVVKYEHPLFAPFKNPNHGDFGTARFYKRFHVAALAGANELLKYDDGTPALIEKQYGRGRVLLFTSTFDTEWTDFPQRGVFLPFIHEMVKYLTLKTSEEKKDYLVNDPVQLSGFDFAPGTTVARKPKASVSVANIFNPSGEEHRTTINEEGSVFYESTDEPGIYSVHIEDQKRYFAVNIDTMESDLRASDPEEVVSMLVNREKLERDLEPAVETIAEYHHQVENNQQIWWYLMAALFVLAIGEMFYRET